MMLEKVGIGEYKVGKGKGVLVAYGLGSCIGFFCTTHPKVGGLAHIMLAGRARRGIPILRKQSMRTTPWRKCWTR